MLPPLFKLLEPSILLLLARTLLIQQNSIRWKLIKKSLSLFYFRRLEIFIFILIVFLEILSGLDFCLLKRNLFLEHSWHFFKSIVAVGLPIVFRTWPLDSSRILTQIFLELLNFIFLLLIVIGIDSLSDNSGPFEVVGDGLKLLYTDSFLLLLFFNAVPESVFEILWIGNVLNEIFASEILVVMIVVYFSFVLVLFLSLLQQLLV